MASSTRERVSVAICLCRPVRTLETVVIETPASAATERMVTRGACIIASCIGLLKRIRTVGEGGTKVKRLGDRKAGEGAVIEFVWVDGTAVRVTSLVRREVGGAVGEGRREVTLVVIVRGKRGHGEMLALLAPGTVTVAIPEEDGSERFVADVVLANHVALGQGEVTAYRHEVTLRERVLNGRDEGVEEIPVSLRLEALIEALEGAGVVTRGAVEAIARRLGVEAEAGRGRRGTG